MAQWVKFLLIKFERLSSNLINPFETLGTMAHTYNSSAGEAVESSHITKFQDWGKTLSQNLRKIPDFGD